MTLDEVELLFGLSRALVGHAVRSITAVGREVTLPQFRALAVLHLDGTHSAGRLAEALGLHVSTVTRLCDRLVAAGLVTRDVRADNRREVQIAVTPAGRDLVERVWQERRATIAEVLHGLDDRQRALLREALPPVVVALGAGQEPAQQAWG